MILLPALLALSVHVLPAVAVAFAFPQTSSTDQCISTSSCTTLLSDLAICGVSENDLNTSLSTSQWKCLCTTSGFTEAAVTCLTCLGTDSTGLQATCNSYSSQLPSTASTSATASASTTKAASTSVAASRTSSSTSQSTSASASDQTCYSSNECTTVTSAFDTCSVTAADIENNLPPSDWQCLCKIDGFASDLTSCMSCLGSSPSMWSSACDGFSSTPASSTGPTRSVATGTGSSATVRVAATNTATSSGSGSTGGTGSLGSGIRTNPNSAATNNIASVLPIFVAVFIYQLIWGF